METHMVDAVAFADLEIPSPLLHVHRYMSCKREYAGIMLPSEEGGMTVDLEL